MTISITMTRAIFAALCLGAAACNASLGDMTDSSANTDGTGGTGGGTDNPTSGASGDGFMPCSNANPCPDGQFCFNGLCALGCNSDGDCADNQYCATDDDKLCHNKEVSTCPDVPCAEGQVCVGGFCSTPPPADECMPQTLPDGCESNALCYEAEEGQPKCYTMPYCAEDGTCPVGVSGAVCNNDLIPDKDKICLIGNCIEVSHCPADWKCVKFGGEVVGFCSSGAFGFPCNSGADCMSGNCMMPIPGVPGTCT